MKAIQSFIESFDTTISLSRAIHEVAKDTNRSRDLRDRIIYERYISALREGEAPDSIKHDLADIYEVSFVSIKNILRKQSRC